MRTNKPKHILIAPLDWGLGHTARCIPIIGHLLNIGHKVTVAGNASQCAFIGSTFKDTNLIHLDGYNITYSKWNKWAQAGLLSQMPAISKKINEEHKWLEQAVRTHKIDGIISDNRYGLFHKTIPSVIMTHQLMVQTGMGALANRAIQRIHYRLLNRFHSTWVVDCPGPDNLGGMLSHSVAMPANASYIGLLSRFAGHSETTGAAGEPESNKPLLVLLSGPEPQRSVLSDLLWQQILQHSGAVTFIDGSDTAIAPVALPAHIAYHKRLTHEQLTPILQSAGMVICRSGYSTLMDLTALEKKAILIPTPGQTEQEYLARHLHSIGAFYTAKQDGFNLCRSLAGASQFAFNTWHAPLAFGLYKDIVTTWAEAL